jgi:transposase-like protein
MKKHKLIELYFNKKLSMAEIAKVLRVSSSKVSYWMDKHKLKRRSISEAIYVKLNPGGNPFKPRKITTSKQFFLAGLGLGLY